MSDVECPYCGADQEINHDDGYGYAEDAKHQQECGDCGQTFMYTTYIHMTYTPHKADCLNGAPHDYQLTKTIPPEFACMECTVCEDRKPRPAAGEGA